MLYREASDSLSCGRGPEAHLKVDALGINLNYKLYWCAYAHNQVNTCWREPNACLHCAVEHDVVTDPVLKAVLQTVASGGTCFNTLMLQSTTFPTHVFFASTEICLHALEYFTKDVYWRARLGTSGFLLCSCECTYTIMSNRRTM